jgi:uncharacterized protein
LPEETTFLSAEDNNKWPCRIAIFLASLSRRKQAIFARTGVFDLTWAAAIGDTELGSRSRCRFRQKDGGAPTILQSLQPGKEGRMKQDKGSWSPYLAGALSGVVGVLSVWLAGQYFGASTSFVRTAGMIEELFGPERVAQMSYFIKVAPKIDWQWMFMVGIFLGAMVAALSSGSFKLQLLPDMWVARFGERSGLRRAVTAFIGGTVAMFGARLADG